MIYLFFLLMNVSFADPSWKWANAIKIVDKHEFYTNNEMITRPKDSWQILFAVLYKNANLKSFKDCLLYKVPGESLGHLKLKTIKEEEKCEDFLYLAGDQEWKNLKALQYSITDKFLSMSLTDEKFQIERWDVPLFNVFEHPVPKALMSSAEYRSASIIYLTPYKGAGVTRPEKVAAIPDKKLCHDIAEDCSVKSVSSCTQCSEGWFEIPNGCPDGPKYCGKLECGMKGAPACRRGMKYQKIDKTYHCSEDDSFAYCMKGLTIQCQGNLPYCL